MRYLLVIIHTHTQSYCTQLCIRPESYKNSLPLLLSLFFIQPSLEFVSIAYNLYLQEINSHTKAQYTITQNHSDKF